MKKLNLKKKVITVLTDREMQSINGGAGTTSYSGCSGFACCSQKPCVPASEGAGVTCLMNDACNPPVLVEEPVPFPGGDTGLKPFPGL
ncbi:class I lanthipeptide [Flavobacterium sp. FlaQc-48]|uniref:class I lanthipeptide n=1 Tax=Flavobacterium sp. FlaQc-48 TaxID=3374181 RepID=UPI0037570B7A